MSRSPTTSSPASERGRALPPALALWLAAALAAGCATPAPERIRFVRTLSGGADVEKGLNRFWRKLARLDEPARLYHPLGVAVSPEGDLVAVTDQGHAQLLLLDVAASRLAAVPRAALGDAPAGVAIAGEEVWVTVPLRKIALAYARDGSPRRAVDLGDCERPVGLAVDRARGLLYASDASSPNGAG